jgi:hypothetical protein
MSESAETPELVAGMLPNLMANAPAEVATQIFVEDLRDRVETTRADTKVRLARLDSRESILFGLMIASGVLAVLLVVAGFLLAVLVSAPLAIATEAVGLLSGAGTATFRQLRRDARHDRNILRSTEEEDTRMLRAIAVTTMIQDTAERNRAMADLAGRLAESVSSRPPRGD